MSNETQKYKFVAPDNKAPFNAEHDFTAHIAGGRFRSVKGPLVLCRNGFHVATASELSRWFYPGTLYEVSVKGDRLTASDKTCNRSLRFDRKIGTVTPAISVQIAQWSAMRAREYARSAESASSAEYAAQSAARYAAESAAGYAAGYAESAARSAGYAAGYAAGHAAKSAESAARSAGYAESAARCAFNEEWTNELIRLLEAG